MYAPTLYSLLSDGSRNRLLFFLHFSLPWKSLHSGTSIAITPSGIQEALPIPVERKYSIRSSLLSLLTRNDLDTLTLLHRSTGSRSSPDISFAPPLSPFLAPGRCFRIWVPSTYQVFYLSLSLRPIDPTNVLLPSTFRKLAGMTFPPTLTPTVLLERNIRLFLFALLLLFLPLWH